MKKIIFLFVLPLSLFACSNDEDVPKENQEQQSPIPPKMQPTPEWPNLLLGKWEFVEGCETNPFGPGYSCNTPYVYYYNFLQDSTILTDQFGDDDCQEGTYNLEEDSLYFEFPCVNSFSIVEVHSLSNTQMVLSSAGDDSVLYVIFKKIEN